ncbi:hypothetical protein XENTR_v10011594 [Xenopus tropicalis]|uniref:Short chain dehydrogenase/reductase family 42E, member 1 n=1 Tax=Xenopus tropicalis TaxID=8364 RepID=A0A803JKF9_XENTR|nr:short-chain dehydrogenase/reductase family 42E member 1 [Xenopus tropicalis]XP_004913667.1 short-chain dehydrogenase/reductase family 42E member 1 [Xenopus tropicalis]XP_031756653.1 short-chain dehydrogenase/reductase family 42E member 1 [Xenopus tropicalis]KAE8608745.1 hypothetical protein XENTR_v10011594 [Xenopus tropicalis]KAE8608746.1 hypothetical protein XENTR_v10011594 [Xenopus tropicalis]KAE8608747.1 hypothetical protein XENTR_v10011594 [Xenopus tropicalis]KAE8608748.1 hypothetical |eukprot:XP_002934995.1 PREDICTED: short-chain dehydrogenase/reductase family 42E member 1 isoform X1 [Xenopus tropicalis]
MSSSQHARQTVVITGGGGYFGHRLGCTLHQKGVNVILFDIRKPDLEVPEGIQFVQGDVRSLSQLEDVMTGASCVFHTASYGMSGREQLQWQKIEAVNVKGTENIIQACINKNVKRLVYTSTFNVVFGGQTIRNGDESLPYLPQDAFVDNYSRTKTIAEAFVLKMNNQELKNKSGFLKTCSLRAAGIYGPGEQRHLPRIRSVLEKGMFLFIYGDNPLVQFVHVDNLISAHILAAEALTSEKKYIAAGQPYFISDGPPVNNFDFFRPFVEGLGYKFPTLQLPLWFIYFLAFLIEWIHFFVSPVCDFQPFLTRSEVCKTGVTHYFSIEKAKRELGFEPQPFTMQEVAEWFKNHGYGKQDKKFKRNYFIWDIIFILLVAVVLLSWHSKLIGTSE